MKKDAEIGLILKSLESQIPNWDTSKCPAVTLSTDKAWSSRGLYKPTYEPEYETSSYKPQPRSVLEIIANCIITFM